MVHQVWDWIDSHTYAFHLYVTREVQDGWETRHYTARYRALLCRELNHILGVTGIRRRRWLSEAESTFYQPVVLATAD